VKTRMNFRVNHTKFSKHRLSYCIPTKIAYYICMYRFSGVFPLFEHMLNIIDPLEIACVRSFVVKQTSLFVPELFCLFHILHGIKDTSVFHW
jgi:hypothetical protein